jgi:hypothetical protein
LNVHDMQCMWYESEVGLSYLRQKNYQLALKNFNYIEKHFDQIYEDQFDFHLYSIRKYTVGAYFQMIEMEDSVYKNKYAVKCAIGIINTLKKINSHVEEEKAKFEPLHKEYLESAEYKKLQEELKKKDEDDDYRNDTDPKGYDHFKKCVSILHNLTIIVGKPNLEGVRCGCPLL